MKAIPGIVFSHLKLLLVLGCCQMLICADAKQLKLDVSAKSAILINADTGAILYEKNAHELSYPASITKIATAWYALEQKPQYLDARVVATQDCISVVPAYLKSSHSQAHPSYRLEPDGTAIGIQVGEVLSFRTLLYGLMLCSGNDAANVIAHYVSGSVLGFMDELNNFFQSKGFKETHFNNPHGLHHPDHYTTAYDMAFMTKEAMLKPLFREIVQTVQYVRPDTNKQPAGTFLQTNRLLRRGAMFYPKAVGVKTGYHSKAGGTLVAAAEHEGRRLIAVVLKCSEIAQRYKDVINLFERAFAEKKVIRILFTEQYDVFSLPIKGAKAVLTAALSEDLKLNYYPSEEPDLKAFIKWDELQAPVLKGQMVGEIQLVNDSNQVLQSAPLFAKADVEYTTLFKVFNFYDSLKPKLFDRRLIFLLMSLTTIWAIIWSVKKRREAGTGR